MTLTESSEAQKTSRTVLDEQVYYVYPTWFLFSLYCYSYCFLTSPRVTWCREAIIAFRQPRPKKINGKKNVTSSRARVAFVIARWDFQSFQDCSLLFPNNFQMHGKLTLNNNCAFKRFFREEIAEIDIVFRGFCFTDISQ